MEKFKSFEDFIKNTALVIPDYQRAYSWGEKQLIPFINDILEHCNNTTYYLGHYILENTENKNIYEIVDGQQRITTIYLFLFVCGYLNNRDYLENINFKTVSYDQEGFKNIQSLLKENINVEIGLEELSKNSQTASLKKMIEAIKLFQKAFSDSDNTKSKVRLIVENIDNYVAVIFNSDYSVATYSNKTIVAQIFELHNTRGIKLSETEKVKALLMKIIYINSIDAENDINYIQNRFADIFKLEEKANEVWLRGNLPLDTILMYHLRAIDDGKKSECFYTPQSVEGERGSLEYIKNAFSKLDKEKTVVYAKNLADEFARSMEIITLEIPKADAENSLIGDLLLLDKNKNLVFLLRSFRNGNPLENKLIERWENFLLLYEIINWNGYFYNSKAFRDNFENIYKSISGSNLQKCNDLIYKYFKNEEKFSYHWGHLGEISKNLFLSGIHKWKSNVYGWDKTGYFLYKYEISNGSDVYEIRNSIFKNDYLSIDHIVARGLSWKNLNYEDYYTLSNIDERKKEVDSLWSEILNVINGIGNLSLSTSTHNSSDSNGLPCKHIKTYEKCGLKQTLREVETWNEPKEFISNINSRNEKIINFISEKIINNVTVWS